MYSCGPLHMDEQKQDDKLIPTYNSCVLIRNMYHRRLAGSNGRLGGVAREGVRDIPADGVT